MTGLPWLRYHIAGLTPVNKWMAPFFPRGRRWGLASASFLRVFPDTTSMERITSPHLLLSDARSDPAKEGTTYLVTKDPISTPISQSALQEAASQIRLSGCRQPVLARKRRQSKTELGACHVPARHVSEMRLPRLSCSDAAHGLGSSTREAN